MGYCGNALTGIHSRNLELIIPRVDDCISLLLGSYKVKAKTLGTYYMTEGWLKGERNIWREYEYTIEKYGEDTGEMIFETMLGHYDTLALLDSGSYDLSAAEEEAKQIAKALQLEYALMRGTLDYLKKLFSGPWSEDSFLTVPPRSTISEADLALHG